MFLIILIKSLIIGALVGVGVGAGAARMFHAPTTQGMGAFRTLGELNSCEGDPASHFSFGLGFFFNAWASSVAAGSFTQDVDHRIIPNWGAAALMIKNRNVGVTAGGWLCLPGGELYRFADNRSGDWPGDWLHHYSGA